MTYARALAQVIRGAKKRKKALAEVKAMAEAAKNDDFAAVLEAISTHDASRVEMGDFEMRDVQWVEDGKTIRIAISGGGDWYVADLNGRVTFKSHEVPGEGDAGEPFEEALWTLVWDLRERGKRTAICDLVGEEMPF